MTRRRPVPPPRPDWRDPNMLVTVSTKRGIETWTPQRLQRVKAYIMEFSTSYHWRTDPTYSLRKPRP